MQLCIFGERGTHNRYANRDLSHTEAVHREPKKLNFAINGILPGLIFAEIQKERAFGNLRGKKDMAQLSLAMVNLREPREKTSFMGDERALLAGLRDLDPQIIAEIHATHFPVVFRYAQYRIGDEAAAEDLASETFIRLLEAVQAGKGPRTSLRGWLMGTVSNLVNDHFRVVYNRPTEHLTEGVPDKTGNPVTQSEIHDRRETLRLAISKLTPDQRHVLALRFGSGCSLAETAEAMGKKTNAIKQLQFRALVALRMHIGGEIE